MPPAAPEPEQVHAPERSARRPVRAHAALALALLANAAGQSLLFVMLPGLGRELGFSDIQTGGLLSAAALILILAAPFWGFMSERIGRRRVLLVGLSGVILGPLLFAALVQGRLSGGLAVSATLVLLFLSRGAQALISGGLMPVAQAYMADTTAAAGRAGGMGLLGAAYGLGAIVGAALAWRVGGDAPVLAFLIAAGLGGVGLVFLVLLVPEPRQRRAMAQVERLHLGTLWPFVLITLLAITAYGLLQQVAALRMADEWGMDMQQATSAAGALMMVTSVAMILCQGIVLRFLRWPPARLLLVGAVLATVGLLAAVLVHSPTELFYAMALFGAAVGLMLPGNLASLSLRAGVDAQGKAAGINAMGQGLGMSLGPILGAGLHQISPLVPFAMACFLLALCTVLALCAIRIRPPARA